MKMVYAAILEDGKLTWLSEEPKTNGPVRVEVEIDEQEERSGKHPVRFLEQLAARGGISSIADPAQWEREQRSDRPLPGRES